MSTLTLVPYHRKHRTAILNLLYYSQRAHVHLDWERPGQWVEREGVQLMLAWEGNHLAGFIGLTPPLNGASWLRLVGLSSRHDGQSVLNMLWQGIQPNLQKSGIEQVAVLVIHHWLEPLLPQLGFRYKEDVVTLYRSEETDMPLPETNSSLVIQPAYTEHLSQIVSVDNAAFPAPWQMSASDMHQARRQASQYMVALSNNRVGGFPDQHPSPGYWPFGATGCASVDAGAWRWDGPRHRHDPALAAVRYQSHYGEHPA